MKKYILDVSVVLLISVFCFSATYIININTKNELIENAHNNLNTVEHSMKDGFAQVGLLSSYISKNSVWESDLSKNSISRENVDKILDNIAQVVSHSVAYVINVQGVVVASSNRNTRNSFLGQNYKFRSYFQNAVQGFPSLSFHVGVTSGIRGFYYATPLSNSKGQVLNVLVIKFLVDHFEHSLLNGVVLLDSSGVVFASTQEEHRLKTIFPLSNKKRESLIKTQMFGNSDLQPILSREFKDEEEFSHFNHGYFLISKTLDINDWKLVEFVSTEKMFMTKVVGGIASLLFSFLAILLLAIYRLRIKSVELETETEDKILSLLDFMPDPVFAINSRGEIIVWNIAMEVISGKKAAEMLGKGNREYSFVLYGTRKPALIDYVFGKIVLTNEEQQQIKRVGRHWISDTYYKNFKEEEFFFSCKAAPIYSRFGEIVGAIQICQDVTQKEKSGIQKERILEQITLASRMATIGALTSGFAHEINNPLTVISGNLSILAMSSLGEEDVQSISDMKIATQKIAEIIKRLRNYARASLQEVKQVDLLQALNEVLELQKIKDRKKMIIYNVDAPEEPIYVNVNQARLQQIFMSILTRIVSSIYIKGKRETVKVSIKSSKESVVVQIVGGGAETWEEDINLSQFEQGLQVDLAGEVSLSVVTSLIQTYNGSIETKKADDVFSILLTLPRVSWSHVVMSENDTTKTNKLSLKENLKILVVDDEDGIRNFLSFFLTSFGAQTFEAKDAEEAIAILKRESVDFLFTDLRMPAMGGDELLKYVRETLNNQNLVCYVMTGGIMSDHSEEEVRNIKKYSNGVLKKPFEVDELKSLLEKKR